MQNNPYVGPRPFERSDRDRFFGRARETRDLLSLIMAERVVLFYAQSGAGKTSLLNTQIVPALEEEGFNVLPIARVGSDAPRGVEAASIKNIFVFSALLTLAGPQVELDRLSPQTLKSFLTSFTNDEHPPVIIFDQFEEILTTHRDRWEEARGFFEQLREALQAIPKLGVVLAMREDHVAGLDPYAAQLPRRLKTRFRMELLGYDGALEAVKKPAQNAGCAYGTGVAERLVDDLRRIQVTADSTQSPSSALGPYIESVQLQVVCSRLWDNLPEREDRIITWPEIEQFGNIDRALTDFYESALQRATQETTVTERRLRRWFGSELITPMKTRGLALRGEHVTNELPNEAVDVLDRQHLIRSEVRAGAYWYELAHDRLVEPIVNSNVAWEQARMTPLRTTAQNWQQSKNDDLLYGGRALFEAQQWARAQPAEVEDYEQEFLEASVRAQHVTARNRIVRLSVIAALSVGLIIMAALAVLALQSKQDADQQRTIAYQAKATAEAGQQEAERQKQLAVTAQAQAEASAREAKTASALAEANQVKAEQQARLAHAGQLAAQSEVALDKYPQRSALLAAEALGVTAPAGDPPVPAARQTIFDVLSQVGGHGVAVHSSPIVNLALSADGHWLATADEDQHARLWDLTAPEPAANPIVLPHGIDRVAISPNGHWLATSGDDPTVRLWDLRSAHPISAPIVLDGQGAPVNELLFSPDSRWLVTSSNLYDVRGWDLEAGMSEPAFVIPLIKPEDGIALVPGERRTYGLAISSDSRWLVSSGGFLDDDIHLWDLTRATDPFTRSVVLPYGHYLGQSAFSPDQKWLATLGGDNLIQLWVMTDVLESRAQPIAVTEENSGNGPMAFSPDGRWLALGNQAGDVQLLAPASPEGSVKILKGFNTPLTSLSFSPDAHWLAATSANTSQVWDLTADFNVDQAALAVPARTLVGHENSVMASAVSSDTHSLVTASWDGTARQWDLQAMRATALPIVVNSSGENISLITVSGDNRWLVTYSESGTLSLRELQTIADPEAASIELLTDGVAIAALTASPDGRWLATAGSDGVARLYDLRSPDTAPRKLNGNAADLMYVAFSPDNRWLLTGSSDNATRLWDLNAPDSPTSVQAFEDENRPWFPSAFSPDGCWLVTPVVGGPLDLWDLQSPDLISTTVVVDPDSFQSVSGVAFSADSHHLLAGADDGGTRVWELSSSGVISPPIVLREGDTPITLVGFSQNDRWAAVVHTIKGIVGGQKIGSYTGSSASYLWDWRSPDQPPVALIQDQLASAALSPDGQWLLIISDMLRLWDLSAPDPSTTATLFPDDPIQPLRGAAFSPNGQWLFLLRDQVQAWNLRPEELRPLACRTAGRNFTRSEWTQYFPGQPYRKTCDQWPLEDAGQ